MKLIKMFGAVAIPVVLSGCAANAVIHTLSDDCLHKINDEDGNVINVEFDAACGRHKENLANVQINAQTQKAVQEIQATQDAQIGVIKEEKTKIFWQALANRASVELGNPQQEDTATRLLIAARTHEDPIIRKMVTDVQNDLGITNAMLNDKNAVWDSIRAAQAMPGVQIIDLGNGEFYMDKYKHPYGPLKGAAPANL